MFDELIKKIEDIKIVPVVVLNDAENAKPLAKALCEGGLPCAEVTFRTGAAEESIRIMHEAYPEMIIGAGTCTRRYELSLHHKDNQIRNDHETFKNQNHVNSLYGSSNFFYGTKFE